MSIKEWPKDEQPREKLLSKGAESLTDAELLAIFLRTGISGQSAVDLARSLLQQFGSLTALLGATKRDFCQAKGLGNAKYAQLKAVMEMAKRHFVEELEHGQALTGPESTQAFLTSQLRHYQHEVFACLFLDNQHKIIEFEELFIGTIDGASVYPREVAKKALLHNAAAVIFAHNHPSGVSSPSMADKQITEKLQKTLVLFEIRVLDHFIIGDGKPFSFAEHGLI